MRESANGGASVATEARPERGVLRLQALHSGIHRRRIAEKAGYRLVGHRLELYGVPMDGKTDRQK